MMKGLCGASKWPPHLDMLMFNIKSEEGILVQIKKYFAQVESLRTFYCLQQDDSPSPAASPSTHAGTIT